MMTNREQFADGSRRMSIFWPIRSRIPHEPGTLLLLVACDEIHHRIGVLARDGEMPLALSHQHRYLAAELFVALLHDAGLVLEQGSRLPQSWRIGAPAFASGARLSIRSL